MSGLLEITYHGSSANTNGFFAYDGNGNVSAVVNAADGTTLANYDYGPFGETIRQTGALAKNNPFRFSSKFEDDESDLLYYGYRYYKPSTGTWLSRDPIQERGGANLYDFLDDEPIFAVDGLGLSSLSLNLLLTYLGFQNQSGLSGSVMQDVINSSAVQDFGQSMLSSAEAAWSCGGHGHFVKSNGMANNFNPSITANSGMSEWQALDYVLSGNWQLLLSASCSWSCSKCSFPLYSAPNNAQCNQCPCTATCTVSGSISKVYTFAYYSGGNTANLWYDLFGVVVTPIVPVVGAPVWLSVYMGETFTVDQSFQTSFSASASANCH